MNEVPADLIDRLRALMPIDTIIFMNRPLSPQEGRKIAEQQAALLLELLGAKEPNAEVERIAELPQIRVRFAPNIPLSGYSEWVDDHWEVGINRDESLWRCRATLCHELKHILDDPYIEILYPTTSALRNMPPEAERLSDYFAGCVLVPREWLARAWDNGIRSAERLASHFGVSESLIRVRLKQCRTGRQSTNAARPPNYTRNHVYTRTKNKPKEGHTHALSCRLLTATHRTTVGSVARITALLSHYHFEYDPTGTTASLAIAYYGRSLQRSTY